MKQQMKFYKSANSMIAAGKFFMALGVIISILGFFLAGGLISFGIGLFFSLVGVALYRKGNKKLGNDTSVGFVAGGFVGGGSDS